MWTLASGVGLDTAGYTPLTSYNGASCGLAGLQAFTDPGGLPSVSHNATGGTLTNTAGTCSSPFTIPMGAITVHPLTRDVVTEWTSPMNGFVTVTGTLTDADTNGGDGVAWQLGAGAGGTALAELAHGSLPNGGSSTIEAASVTRIPVSRGTVIALVVTANGTTAFDATNVALTVTPVA